MHSLKRLIPPLEYQQKKEKALGEWAKSCLLEDQQTDLMMLLSDPDSRPRLFRCLNDLREEFFQARD
jgi:hypothetical protein